MVDKVINLCYAQLAIACKQKHIEMTKEELESYFILKYKSLRKAMLAYHKHQMSVEEMFMFIRYERYRVKERFNTLNKS